MGKTAYTPKEFAAKMDDFIGCCERGGIDATDYQLIKFFGISPGTLEKYRAADKLNSNSKNNAEGYGGALKKLDLYREDATIRQAVTDPKLASHCALKLRQPHWGGWSDKGEAAQDLSVRVKIGDGDRALME